MAGFSFILEKISLLLHGHQDIGIFKDYVLMI